MPREAPCHARLYDTPADRSTFVPRGTLPAVWDWIGKLDELRRTGESLALVTVIRCVGSTPRELGAKMLVRADGRFFGTIGGGNLEQLVIEDARRCLGDGAARTFRYPLGARAGQCCGGLMELLVEVINAGPRLYLFGAGHVGQALCRVLAGTPFSVDLVDERPEWLERDQLPAAIRTHAMRWDEFAETAPWSEERTFVAVMTHRHDLDEEIIRHVVLKPAKYIGLIGSQAKWSRFRHRLEERGIATSQLDRVRCPIGLPVGGKAPQEVAISIAAELLQTFHASAER
jgi:xanthine dehydrogenase accessory factor